MSLEDRYLKILHVLCTYYGMSTDDLIKLLEERDNKYLLLLLLKKYKCMGQEKVKEVFNVKNKRTITNNVRRAEEKLLINRDFRKKFFEMEEDLLK